MPQCRGCAYVDVPANSLEVVRLFRVRHIGNSAPALKLGKLSKEDILQILWKRRYFFIRIIRSYCDLLTYSRRPMCVPE